MIIKIMLKQKPYWNYLLELDLIIIDSIFIMVTLMGWETSTDTMSEVKLEFDSKELAIHFAKENNIEYYIIEPQKSKIVKKSYADNFVKN